MNCFLAIRMVFLAIRLVLRTVLWNVRFLNCLGNNPQLPGIKRLVLGNHS
jgi:hypothetical protein